MLAVKSKYPEIKATVFDLPNVISVARSNKHKVDNLANLILYAW